MDEVAEQQTAQDEEIAKLLDRCRYRGPTLAWDRIIGHAPAKRELAVIAEQYRRQSDAEALGLTLIKGILILGEPGCGKTMLARALAGSIDRPVYVVPSAEVGAALIRRIYDALRDTPCVIVWDEADVILRKRLGSTDREERQIVASFCAALDGLDTGSGPITIALTATGEWQLDPSALRSGRLTTKIELLAPDRDDRRRLWDLYTDGVPRVGNLDLDTATDRSVGMNGADIQATVMVALGLSMVAGIDALDDDHLGEALLRRGHVQEQKESLPAALDSFAIHEAGHAVFAAMTWGATSVATVSVRRVSRVMGHTQLADWLKDDQLPDRTRFRAHAAVSLAGMVAEELVRPDGLVSSGCGDDISEATRLLANLVGDFGDDERFGPVAVDVLESGSHSDRGSDVMRADLFQAVSRESIRLQQEVRHAMQGVLPTVLAVRDALLAATDHTLSGDALAELLTPVAPR